MVCSQQKEFEQWWKENKKEIVDRIYCEYLYIFRLLKEITEEAFNKGYEIQLNKG